MPHRTGMLSVSLCAGLLLFAELGLAQVASRISGTVQDATGAAMREVKVTATDVDRGASLTTVTN